MSEYTSDQGCSAIVVVPCMVGVLLNFEVLGRISISMSDLPSQFDPNLLCSVGNRLKNLLSPLASCEYCADRPFSCYIRDEMLGKKITSSSAVREIYSQILI